MFDIGPYYLTALVSLLGPVVRVSGTARKSFPERIATSEARRGERLPVEVPTHYAATLDFASGPVASIIMSFDIWAHNLPRIEIYGSEGTAERPRSEHVRRSRAGQAGEATRRRREVPLTHPYSDNSRGLGLSDMAQAIQEGRPHRASGELALHVLDLMESVQEASEAGQYVQVRTTCARPTAMPDTRGRSGAANTGTRRRRTGLDQDDAQGQGSDIAEPRPSHIGTLNEKPLHAALKRWYGREGDRFEVRVDGFFIDIVRPRPGRPDLLVEIQTQQPRQAQAEARRSSRSRTKCG